MGGVVNRIMEHQVALAWERRGYGSHDELMSIRTRLMLLLPLPFPVGTRPSRASSICVQVMGVGATVFEDSQSMERLLSQVRESELEMFPDMPSDHERLLEIVGEGPVLPWRSYMCDLVLEELLGSTQDRFLTFFSSTELLVRGPYMYASMPYRALWAYAMMWRSGGTWVLDWVQGEPHWPMDPSDTDHMRDRALVRARHHRNRTVPPAPGPPAPPSSPPTLPGNLDQAGPPPAAARLRPFLRPVIRNSRHLPAPASDPAPPSTAPPSSRSTPPQSSPSVPQMDQG